MSNSYDEEKAGSKHAMTILIVVAFMVALALAFGLFQVAKAITGRGAEAANSTIVEEVEPEAPAIAPAEEAENDSGVKSLPYDGGAGADDFGQVFDFGEIGEIPADAQYAADRIIGETNLVTGYIGLEGTPVTGVNDCNYLTYGYYACPIGGSYYQIIDMVHQATFAFAKKGEDMPREVTDKFKENYTQAAEGIGGGALEGYYVISRGAVQNLATD